MANIQVLDQITIDKIAAGEVIERPASIVKELVENAVDAGATAVTVEIKDGGISFIRITDNGCGIPREEVPVAFLRHSTSKIRSAEDLASVTSLGFRGEALSSIAAIAQVELITKTKDALLGTRYQIEGGIEKKLEDAGAKDGSTFLIHQIFYNTPARRKFLKTAMTEASHVNELMIRLALSHPEISFEFINNHQTKLHTSGNGKLKDVIYQVYGREITQNLIEVEETLPRIKITGYIGRPLISRGNRNFENYYINGRYVKSNLIARAIEDAYKGLTMQHKYPFTVLHFEIDGDELDVNVHPTKMELRLHRQQEVYELIYHSLKHALINYELIPRVTLPEAKKTVQETPVISKGSPAAEMPAAVPASVPPAIPAVKASPVNQEEKNLDYFMKKMQERVTSYHKQISQAEVKDVHEVHREPEQRNRIQEAVNYRKEHEHKPVPKAVPKPEPKQEQLNLFDDGLLSQKALKKHKLIGQVFDTYWMVEYNDELYIIDQHAAHERVLYEKTIKGLQSREYTSQYLSPPIVLNLTMQEAVILKSHMTEFERIGFEMESFGEESYVVRAVPDNLFAIAKKELLIEMLDGLTDELSSSTAPNVITEKIASMSCKAAVKGNSRLSAIEMESLITELLSLENPYHCPHGRPTIIAMTKKELEKKFKRIV